MIFVSVGTRHNGFDRLIKKLDELSGEGKIKEQIVAQIGNGKYIPSHIEAIKFCSPQEFDDLISQSSMVVSHAGVGVMMSAILKRKPVIALPRKASLNEMDDDHQFNTAKQFEQEEMILVAYDESQLEGCFDKAKHFIPTSNSSGLENIKEEVQKFLDTVEESIK